MTGTTRAIVSSCLLAVFAAAAAHAQTTGVTTDMKALLKDGFEIKAAAPNGDKFVVFLQRDREAYACEFVTLTTSRCGAINRESQ